MVFNLDSSIGNEELQRLFGTYGEVKEIRETPRKKNHKFVEYYDIRAAATALHCLNHVEVPQPPCVPAILPCSLSCSHPFAAPAARSQSLAAAHPVACMMLTFQCCPMAAPGRRQADQARAQPPRRRAAKRAAAADAADDGGREAQHAAHARVPVAVEHG